MSMQVVKCTTRVRTLIGNIEGIVTGICIREASVVYEVCYFHNGAHVEAWLKRYEFEIVQDNKKPAGFVNHDRPVDDSAFSQTLLIEGPPK